MIKVSRFYQTTILMPTLKRLYIYTIILTGSNTPHVFHRTSRKPDEIDKLFRHAIRENLKTLGAEDSKRVEILKQWEVDAGDLKILTAQLLSFYNSKTKAMHFTEVAFTRKGKQDRVYFLR